MASGRPGTAGSEWDTRYERRAIILLAFGFGLVGVDRWIIAPLAPAIIASIDLQPQSINNLVAILGVTWGLSAILMGRLSDRIGLRKVLLPVIILFSLFSGISGLAGSFATLPCCWSAASWA